MMNGVLQEIEAEKQKNLKGESESPVKGAPGWNEKVCPFDGSSRTYQCA
jgi:hypothetical protein